MAIATGTAAVIGAGLAAGGTVAAAKMQSNANRRATESQNRQTDSALAYQREQDAYARSQEERRWQDYQQRHAAWEQRNFGSRGGGSGPVNNSPVANAARAAVMGGGSGAIPPQQVPQSGGDTIATLMGQPGQAPVAEVGMAPDNLANLAQWSRHQNYFGQA